ncbi:hypothetical protein GYMLUDRAFT_72163 [Collybiopsis luxurians FD-317 M1]|uniref:C3H1-type domain-containing protein n=1 Tax=Collybiopsis luxurians FD-317 M1 TaxID=944289 RepID=A0A0D0CTX4_9AGAR|nr:hypothetical protein GYMLUDRAFT_72163 [Collybiopsis luxurians FD-317 M1]
MDDSTKPFNAPRYYAWLASEYNDLTLYNEAEAIATRALELQPSKLKARYNRAIARSYMNDLHGAIADVDALFKPKPKKLESQIPGVTQLRDSLHAILQVDEPSDATKKTLSWPDPDSVPAKPTKDDHRPRRVEASGQIRDALPCRTYNKATCSIEDCRFSHTPDTNSIRDTEGRNVCLNFLLGRCTRTKCFYKHSTSGLPKDITTAPSLNSTFTLKLQWWNDPVRMKEVGRHLDERHLRLDREYQDRVKARAAKAAQVPTTSTEKPAKGKVPAKKISGLFVAKQAAEHNKLIASKPKSGIVGDEKLGSRKPTFKASAKLGPSIAMKKRDQKKVKPQQDNQTAKLSRYPLPKTAKSLQKFTNCGLTDKDVDDLIDFGVNPWDEVAHSVFAEVDDYPSD